MIKTRSRTISKMNASPICHVDENGMFSLQSADSPGGREEAIAEKRSISRRVPPLQYSSTVDKLASALLDDSTSELFGQNPERARYVPFTIEDHRDFSNPKPLNNTIQQKNMAAFTANHQIATSARHVTSEYPSKILAEQDDPHATHQKLEHGMEVGCLPRFFPPQDTIASPVMSETSVTKLTLFTTMDMMDISRQVRSGYLQEHNPQVVLAENRNKANRRSMTDAKGRKFMETAAIRRSQTARTSRKTTLAKQKSVFKKVTDAITDRLHFTQKDLVAEDTDVGSDLLQSVKHHVVAQQAAQGKEPSTRRQVIDCQSPQVVYQCKTLAQSATGHGSPARSMSFIGDPFISSPDDAYRTPCDFVNRLKASSGPRRSCSTPHLTQKGTAEASKVLRGSPNSLLSTPDLASTPRVAVNTMRRLTCSTPKKFKVLTPEPSNYIVIQPSSVSAEPSDIHQDDDVMEFDDFNTDLLAPRYTYPTGGQVVKLTTRATRRKKHPSPSKTDLAILGSRLRSEYPVAMSRKTRRALQNEMIMTKKHPSPRKVDMQALEKQFRQLYPEVIQKPMPEKSTPEKVASARIKDNIKEKAMTKKARVTGNKSEKIVDKGTELVNRSQSTILDKDEKDSVADVVEESKKMEAMKKQKTSKMKDMVEDMDELAPDWPLPNPSKPPMTRTKSRNLGNYPRLEPPHEVRPQTEFIRKGCYSSPTMPDCSCPGSDRVSRETDCALHGSAMETNELQWDASHYMLGPRHVC